VLSYTHTHGAGSVGKLCGSGREMAVAHTADRTGEEFFYADGVFSHDKQSI